MDKKKTSIRTVCRPMTIREGADGKKSRTIEGCAIVFGQPSQEIDDWGEKFTEYIDSGCVTAEFLKTQDVKMNLLHDRKLTLARCNKGEGSMTLDVRDGGLYFSFDAPKCDIGDQALELVRRGDYSGCSFEFIPKDYDTLKDGDKVEIHHKKFEAIFALTIGMDPAYTQTSVGCREMLSKTEKVADEKKRARNVARMRQLANKIR